MKAIGYLRVSSKDQGKSGLSLDHQRNEITNFCNVNDIELVGIEVEVKSGGKALNTRPILTNAMNRCEKEQLVLIISKLDRLSRDSHEISGLMNRSFNFVVTQFGLRADKMMIQMYAILAEKERDLIKQRTKDALAQKRANGDKMGYSDSLTDAVRDKASQIIQEQTINRNQRFVSFISDDWKAGKNLSQIARKLNELKVETPFSSKKNVHKKNGDFSGIWQAIQVKRIIARFNITR